MVCNLCLQNHAMLCCTLQYVHVLRTVGSKAISRLVRKQNVVAVLSGKVWKT